MGRLGDGTLRRWDVSAICFVFDSFTLPDVKGSQAPLVSEIDNFSILKPTTRLKFRETLNLRMRKKSRNSRMRKKSRNSRN